MREIKHEKKVIINCNYCNKDYTEEYISFDSIQEIHMRLYEHKKNAINSHLTYGRKLLDFCSTDCALEYLHKDTKAFIREITSNKVGLRK